MRLATATTGAAPSTPASGNTALVPLALAAIYLIWGSTYLAILYALQTIPPFLMVGVRYLVAGGLLYGWLAARGETLRTTAAHWRSALLYGTLFFLFGNGGVTWSETRIPSGIAALLIGMMPFWTALIEWMSGKGRPSGTAVAGIVVGFVGIVILVGPNLSFTKMAVDPLGVLACVLADVGWSYALVHSKHAPRPGSILQTVAMQMLCGGAVVMTLATLLGEWRGFHPERITLVSHLSFWYLVIFGSIVAFCAFTYLMKVMRPSRVATYAFVNPIVAVLLGWLVAGEAVTVRTLMAGAAVVAGVFLILRARAREQGPAIVPLATKETG